MDDILIIEDNPRLRHVLARLLTGAGYQVCEADNGAQGLAVFRSERPSLVITDIVMPNKEGIETIRELREENPGIAIIAMSGDSSISDVYLHAATALGATASIAKPFSPDKLLDLVAQLLEKSRAAPNRS